MLEYYFLFLLHQISCLACAEQTSMHKQEVAPMQCNHNSLQAWISGRVVPFCQNDPIGLGDFFIRSLILQASSLVKYIKILWSAQALYCMICICNSLIQCHKPADTISSKCFFGGDPLTLSLWTCPLSLVPLFKSPDDPSLHWPVWLLKSQISWVALCRIRPPLFLTR